MWRRTSIGVSALILVNLLIGVPDVGATPAGAYASANVTRFAQAEWTTGTGKSRIRWLLTAQEFTYANAWSEPSTSSGAQVTLSKLTCGREGCRVGGPSWPLDQDNFTYDPLLNEVRVSLPGRVHLVWRATEGHQLATARRVRPGIWSDAYEYVGADAEVEAVAAIQRPAKVSGRIKSYPGRIKVLDAYIYLWTGTWGFGGVCVIDQGFPCL